ncbi:MAG: DEAD/DEAH box helicase [Flavobacteriales bacterium]|nr:DEAD/DEAH box helicase [Flavobacteriales bacterium]
MKFSDLNLNTPLQNALNDLGYETSTPIQEKAYSVIMSGKDVLGIAQTGTGKTFAYLLPSLRLYKYSKDRNPQLLILVPTRELVVQVQKEIEKLTTYMSAVSVGLYGGTNIKTQIEAVLDGCDIVVATPGRLLDIVLNGSLRLKNVKKLVVDEVDEMLSLGFRSQLVRIFDLMPAKRQNLLFSATLGEEVETFLEEFFESPERIEAAPSGTPLENISQNAYTVPNHNTKLNLLELLLKDREEMQKVLVFVSTKQFADRVHQRLEEKFPGETGVIHSNKDQNYRFNAVKNFQNGTFRVLIATDLIARGLDIQGVSHVINFDIPDIPEQYIHRIGRTGRADKQGVSITLFTPRDEEERIAIEHLMDMKIPEQMLPEELTISDVLIEEELPQYRMKNISVRIPKRDNVGEAFHEKKDKNKKVNQKLRRADLMKLKYGKPKTRGDKGKKKKKR